MKSTRKIIAPIILEQSKLFEILLIAVVLAFGVNFVSDYFSLVIITLSPVIGLILGIVCIFITLCYLAIKILGKRREIREYRGFFVYNDKQKSILGIPRYDFGEHIERYLKAAFTENDALKQVWEKEPLTNIWKNKPPSNDEATESKEPRSKKIVSELVEYYVLDKLSVHLVDYFNSHDFAEKDLREYDRKDIPDVLLSNRFLELFSKPMEDRPQFINETFTQDNSDIVAMSAEDGAIYNRFELVLPRKSSIRRPELNTIEINTNRMTIQVQVIFEGSSTVLPVGFTKLYLDIADDERFENYTEYKVEVNLKVELKFGFWLSTTGWEYYHWIDSFLDELNEDLDQDGFFTRLNWENAYTVFELVNQYKAMHSNNDIIPT